jgi:hypothetical protein
VILQSSMDWLRNKQASGDDFDTSEANYLVNLTGLSLQQSGLSKEQKASASEDAIYCFRNDYLSDFKDVDPAAFSNSHQ